MNTKSVPQKIVKGILQKEDKNNLSMKSCPKHMIEKRQHLQQMLLGQLDICPQKTKTRPMSFTLYQYQLKVD
jgi:hypothetical protein